MWRAKLVRAAAGCLIVSCALLAASGGQATSSRSVDFRQFGDRLVASGEVGAAALGIDLALSADGDTALVGGFFDDANKGAAWTFVRSGGAWAQLGGKLTSGENDQAQFGRSVALSADGMTALVGGNEYGVAKGAAWVYARSGSSWTPQTKLVPNDEAGAGRFGTSVALSADGNIALVGGPSDNWAGTNTQHGAAWIFARIGSTWTQLGPKLIPGGEATASSFGTSVALSADAATALIGGTQDANGVGAAWVFTRYKPDGWSQQGPKLTQSGSPGALWFGRNVALSSDGSTALIGSEFGGAWVFTRSASSWTQQGPKLAPSDPVFGPANRFGQRVALSADGDTALIADPFQNGRRGAFWSFVRVAGTWAQDGSRTEAGGEVGAGDFGTALDLASDGNSAFVGAPAHDSGLGAVWSFVARPVVASVTPASGSTTGGTQITISGSELANAGQVLFGSTPAASFTVVSRSTISAVAPRHAPGTVDVTVSHSGGTSAVTAAARFTYVTTQATPPPPPPPPPPPSGGTPPPPSGTTNQRPTMAILSARVRGSRLYLRMRVCDDSGKNLTIIERDSKPGVRSFTRRFATLRPPRPCAALTRSWVPAARFGHGRYTITVWARDTSAKTSRPARKTLIR